MTRFERDIYEIEHKENNNNNGCGLVLMALVGLLAIVFTTLKLCKIISWAWVWVLSPIWIYVIFIIAVILITLILNLISYILGG